MPINRLEFSPNGNYLASTGLFKQDVKIWRIANEQEEPDNLQTFDEGESEQSATHQVDTVAISGDASLIACADRTQKVSVWESASGTRLHVFRGFHFNFSGIYPGISVLAIRPGGKELAVVDEN